MKVSVIVPSTSLGRLGTLLRSLAHQSVKPHEVVIVVKNVEVNSVEKVCNALSLNCIVLEQRVGYVTRALNMGKDASAGDIVVFTDDDAIALPKWLKRYGDLFKSYGDRMGCVSSRDIYVDISRLKLLPTPDDEPYVRLYRMFIRPILEKPIPMLGKYWCGVYIDKGLNIRHGPCIPSKVSYSLPLRGVNMAFRGDALKEATFPEHPLLRRAIGYEQYVGLQLVAKGWDCVYVPNNPILHMARASSLSRGRGAFDNVEGQVMKVLIYRLLHNGD